MVLLLCFIILLLIGCIIFMAKRIFANQKTIEESIVNVKKQANKKLVKEINKIKI